MPAKKQKQSKVVVPELLFHEALGRDLSDKFFSQIPGDDKCVPLGRYFRPLLPTIDPCPARYYDDWSSTESVVGEALIKATELAIVTSKAPKIKDRSQVSKRIPNNKTLYSLDDLNSAQTIEKLVQHYGRMTHMGVRDHSYQFFLNDSRTGAISYRLIRKVAVISGDPICPTWQYQRLLNEFEKYCRSQHWKFAMNGCSEEMAVLAKELGWTTIHVARERVIDVQSNPVLLGSEGKRIRTQCKQIMKSGTSLGIYSPEHRRDLAIEEKISHIYEDWRAERNTTSGPQAYVTVFDLFSLSRIMTFIYAYDSQGFVSGFAALRRMKDGYHIDPCITTPEAPRGTVDLLLTGAMAFLREAGLQRLALGVEPLEDLGVVINMPKTLERLTRKSYKFVTAELPLGGKKGFNDRFRPDESLEGQLYLVYPNTPGLRQQVAIAHFSNVELHKALKQRYSRELNARVKGVWKRKDGANSVQVACR